MELHWIHEAAQRPQTQDDQLYAAAIAPPQAYLVAIYDGAEHDPEASARDGRQRFRNVPMIAIRLMGETDFRSQPITEEHKARFPRAWKIYRDKREQWAHTLPLQLMPGITPADVAELEALDIKDIGKLAESDTLPDNLEPLRLLAKRIHKPHVRLVDGKPVAA